nr:formin-like protein 6 [Lolium perenne]
MAEIHAVDPTWRNLHSSTWRTIRPGIAAVCEQAADRDLTHAEPHYQKIQEGASLPKTMAAPSVTKLRGSPPLEALPAPASRRPPRRPCPPPPALPTRRRPCPLSPVLARHGSARPDLARSRPPPLARPPWLPPPAMAPPARHGSVRPPRSPARHGSIRPPLLRPPPPRPRVPHLRLGCTRSCRSHRVAPRTLPRPCRLRRHRVHTRPAAPTVAIFESSARHE